MRKSMKFSQEARGLRGIRALEASTNRNRWRRVNNRQGRQHAAGAAELQAVLSALYERAVSVMKRIDEFSNGGRSVSGAAVFQLANLADCGKPKTVGGAVR